MKAIEFMMDDCETTTFVPVEASLAIRGTVELFAEVQTGDFDDLWDLFLADADFTGEDPKRGGYLELGTAAFTLEHDDEVGTLRLVLGDVDADGDDLVASVHYHGSLPGQPDGCGASAFICLNRASLAKFWRRAKVGLRSREFAASGATAKKLALVIAVLRYADGEQVDLNRALSEWLASSGRQGGARIIAAPLKTAA